MEDNETLRELVLLHYEALSIYADTLKILISEWAAEFEAVEEGWKYQPDPHNKYVYYTLKEVNLYKKGIMQL